MKEYSSGSASGLVSGDSAVDGISDSADIVVFLQPCNDSSFKVRMVHAWCMQAVLKYVQIKEWPRPYKINQSDYFHNSFN